MVPQTNLFYLQSTNLQSALPVYSPLDYIKQSHVYTTSLLSLGILKPSSISQSPTRICFTHINYFAFWDHDYLHVEMDTQTYKH